MGDGVAIIIATAVALLLAFARYANNQDNSNHPAEPDESEPADSHQDETVSETSEEPNTEITEADIRHELERTTRQRQEAHQEWIEYEKAREAAKQEKEKARRNDENVAIASGVPKPGIFFIPIMFAIAAIFDMPSGYYTFFKTIVLIEAIILIGLRLSEGKFRSTVVAIGTVYMSVMALLGIMSFMTYRGFDKTMWVILDIVYCIIHALLYFGLMKQA